MAVDRGRGSGADGGGGGASGASGASGDVSPRVRDLDGLWLATAKVRGAPPGVAQITASLLAAEGLPAPARGPTLSRALPEDGPVRPGRPNSTPLSILCFADRPRLFLTQALDVGTFGKFRLGLWEDAPVAAASVVAIKELRLENSSASRAARAPAPKTLATSRSMLFGEIDALAAPCSPLPLARAAVFHDKVFLSTPLSAMSLDVAMEAWPTGDDPSFSIGRVAAFVAEGAACSLAPMHAANLVHCDVKVGNLFVGLDGRLRLGDLGLAQRLEGPRGAWPRRVGTPGYAAPELWAGAPAGFSPDVWALSTAVAVVLLQRPVFGDSPSGPGGAEDDSVDAYVAFHAALEGAWGDRLSARHACGHVGHPFWRNTFARLDALDRGWADFLIARGLHPDPGRRATLDEVLAFARARLAALGEAPGQADPFLVAQAAGGGPHALARAQLVAFRQAYSLAAEGR